MLNSLKDIFSKLTPTNINDIPLIKIAQSIFIDAIERNSKVAKRITNIFDIQERNEDSELLNNAKRNLKENVKPVKEEDETIINLQVELPQDLEDVKPDDVKGKNGQIKSMKIPYKVNEPQNIVSYEDGTIIYDKIISTTKVEGANKMIIKYAKGITSGDTEEQSGIHYEETLYYSENNLAKVPIDGMYMADLYYDVLGDDSEKTSVYSEEFRKYRLVRKAKITGMEVGTQWTEESAVNAMLFTKDGYEGLQEESKYDINLLYNRGNAAAWENHFKLSECNTMEDLVNYGNNFFNL